MPEPRLMKSISVRTYNPGGGVPYGAAYSIGGTLHFWTGRIWVSKAYLRTVRDAPRRHSAYDKHNSRREAIEAKRGKA